MDNSKQDSQPEVEKVGKYKVLKVLGSGAMGKVYLGEDPYIGRKVAIKVMINAGGTNRERFLHEARIVGGLSHPNIVVVHEFGFHNDQPFLVMEFLTGESLDQWMRREQDLGKQCRIVRDVAGAIAYAHEQAVLHRDIKPANVQVLPNGSSKLMDFGIARASKTHLTATGVVLGTPVYMAPEILRDAAYSPKADLYSLGMLCYEMFAGDNPFRAKTIEACLTKVLTVTPESLEKVNPEIPAALSAAVMAYIEKEPDKRPATTEPLIAVLDSLDTEDAVQAAYATGRTVSMESSDQPAGEPPRDGAGSRVAVISALGAILLFLILAGISWMTRVDRRAASGRLPHVTAKPPAKPSAKPSATPPATSHATAPATTPAATPTTEAGTPPVTTPTRVPATSPNVASPKAGRTPHVARPGKTRQAPRATPARTEPRPIQGTPKTRPPTPESHVTPTEAQQDTPGTMAASPPPPAASSPPSPRATSIEKIPLPLLESIAPASVRRGGTFGLRIRGSHFTPDLKLVVKRGRRKPAGLKIIRLTYKSSSRMEARLLIDSDAPLGTYTVLLVDSKGRSSGKKLLDVNL